MARKRKRISKKIQKNTTKVRKTKITEKEYYKAFVKVIHMGNGIQTIDQFPAYSRYVDLFKEQYSYFVGNGKVLDSIKEMVNNRLHGN